MSETTAARDAFATALGAERGRISAMAKALIACRSETPRGDTRAMAGAVTDLLADIPDIEVERHASAPHIVNLVMRVRAARPGRRLILNGHMDTFPLGDAAAWTADPAGEERDGRLYGLGSSDMKSGLAAILYCLRQMAKYRDLWAGEVVATFAGDEETMGELGSQFLLDRVPHAKGDAMISADAGSPRVLRFGEKGMIWLTLQARGRSAHAAHVHRGDSAIDKLLAVIGEMQKLRSLQVVAPAAVTRAIAEASSISERLSGVGESDVLGSVTVTVGTLHGGRLRNLVSDSAEATADIRIPIGLTVEEVERAIRRAVAAQDGVTCTIDRRYEPTWTAPDHEIVNLIAENCAEVLGVTPVRNIRVGASDARLYRRAGVPTVVCGLTPYNMGGADEYVELSELMAVGDIFALTAFDFLRAEGV